MQAVRLARYHTRRTHLVRFCGAYHGWWGDVQPGVGNPQHAAQTYTLSELSDRALQVLGSRRDIACVLVNPLQALHPNASAPGDNLLLDSGRRAHYDRAGYTEWLKALRAVCTRARHRADLRRGVRRLPAGAGRRAGILRRACRPRHLRQDARRRLSGRRAVRHARAHAPLSRGPAGRHLLRARHLQLAPHRHGRHGRVPDAPQEPADPGDLRRPCRSGTGALRRSTSASRRKTCRCGWRTCRASGRSTTCSPRATTGCTSTTCALAGLALSWVGTGRLIFSLNFSAEDYEAVASRLVAAARQMREDGWWWPAPQLSNKAIRRRIFREMLQARWASASRSRIGSMSSPRHR